MSMSVCLISHQWKLNNRHNRVFYMKESLYLQFILVAVGVMIMGIVYSLLHFMFTVRLLRYSLQSLFFFLLLINLLVSRAAN